MVKSYQITILIAISPLWMVKSCQILFFVVKSCKNPTIDGETTSIFHQNSQHWRPERGDHNLGSTRMALRASYGREIKTGAVVGQLFWVSIKCLPLGFYILKYSTIFVYNSEVCFSGFPSMGVITPKWMVDFPWKFESNDMIWGYPYLRKPPYSPPSIDAKYSHHQIIVEIHLSIYLGKIIQEVGCVVSITKIGWG